MLSSQLQGDMSLANFHTLAQGHETRAKAMARVKFTWRRSERKEMLHGIKGCNDWLSKMQQALESAEPLNRQLRNHDLAEVTEVPASAQRLYNVLTRYCTCDCTATHWARLCLKKSYCSNSLPDEVYFEAVIFHKPHAPCEAAIRVSTCGYVKLLLETLVSHFRKI